MRTRNVAYIYDNELRLFCDKLPNMQFRATMVQDLISSYKLLQDPRTVTIKSIAATEDELRSFHTSDFIDCVKNHNSNETKLDKYGLSYDCPIIDDLFDLISSLAGSSLTAAKVLNKTDVKYVINWFGGWHHAQSDLAEGFCYVNDIVLAINKLLEKHARVLYIDLDVHHGNGVQNAFYSNDRVLTLSIHKQSPGFYPGSGSLDEIGTADGEYFNINVPFTEYCSDKTYSNIFQTIYKNIVDSFQPTAIVTQCGADILAGDPIGECNITIETMGQCIQMIKDCDIPTIFLGGGGYNPTNTARYWTYLTSIILNKQIDEDIPDNAHFFTDYKPSYELHIDPTFVKDLNTPSYISSLTETVLDYCKIIKQRVASKSMQPDSLKT